MHTPLRTSNPQYPQNNPKPRLYLVPKDASAHPRQAVPRRRSSALKTIARVLRAVKQSSQL